MTIPVDATRVVGARWELRNRNGVQVDEGQLGFLTTGPLRTDLLAIFQRAFWIAALVVRMPCQRRNMYILTTAVRFTTGQFQRESLTFAVQ